MRSPRKEFSKSMRSPTSRIVHPPSSKQPERKSRISVKMVKPTKEEEKTDKEYTFSIDDYVVLFNKDVINRNEIITVVQKKSNNKKFLAITFKESTSNIFPLLWIFFK